jgi:Flp pilus assembly protein TadG
VRTNERKGSIVVLVTLLMVVLLGFGAFAVDISQMQAYKSELRRTADAAVLASTLQLLHETQYAQAGAMAQAYVLDNPVLGDTATIVSLEYGRHNGSDFLPLSCNPNCQATPTAIAAASAIRLSVTGSGTFYLAQFLGGSDFTLAVEATAWLPVAATPCAAPWALHDTIWRARYPGTPPGSTTLRNQTNALKLFTLKQHELATDPLPMWYGAINLPGLTTSGQPYDAVNGVLNYAQNIFPGPPWASIGATPFCHVLQPGDLLQGKGAGLDDATITGLGTGGLISMCSGLYAGNCYNVGGQIGVAVRAPIVGDANGGPCTLPPVYGIEDDFGGNTAKCLVVLDVRTFVVIFGIGSGSEQGFVSAVYAGNDTTGPARGYAQRPILVQ